MVTGRGGWEGGPQAGWPGSCEILLRALPAQEARRLLQGAHGGAEPDPLQPPRPAARSLRSSGPLRPLRPALLHQALQALQGEGQVGPPLRPHQGVDLVHDDVAGGAEHPRRALRAEHQVQRFGGGDQDLRRAAHHPLPVPRRGIARAHPHPRRRQGLPQPAGLLPHPRQGDLEVPLHVVIEGLEGGDVEHPHPRPVALLFVRPSSAPSPSGRLRLRLLAQLPEQDVQAPQEGRQRLPAPRGGQHQGVLPPGDDRPAGLLGGRRRPEGAPEPAGDGRREEAQGVRLTV